MICNMRKDQTKKGHKNSNHVFISEKCYLFNTALLDGFNFNFSASHNYQI